MEPCPAFCKERPPLVPPPLPSFEGGPSPFSLLLALVETRPRFFGAMAKMRALPTTRSWAGSKADRSPTKHP